MRKCSLIVYMLLLLSSAVRSQSAFDSLEYAPGYPAYSVSQYDQLKEFPLPRYPENKVCERNFSWYDFLYMGYDYSKVYINPKNNIFVYPGWNKADHAAAAVKLNAEMYLHWNYYFNIPTPSYNYSNFGNPATIAGAAAKYANDHPDVKTCTILFWAGLRMKQAGYDTPKSYINYRTSIDPCADTTFPDIVRDGIAQRKCLKILMAQLPDRDPHRKIDLINENGERFGDVWTPNAEGYRSNPFIKCIQPDSVHARSMRAHWQYNVFNTYKRQFIASDSISELQNSAFSFYQVWGGIPEWYSEWKEMRYINYPFPGSEFSRNTFLSTPDFYPGKTDHNIFDRYSFYHGLDCIAEGRKYEVSCGDEYFSPFMCAGWFADSFNYRPAEWLAACKANAAMGALFFYGAYFNEMNPAKEIPNDPRGYIYQVAMISYAQAVSSRYTDILYNSHGFDYQKRNNTLCITRKEIGKERYMIFAAVFHDDKAADYKDQAVHVKVGEEELKVNARKQGSVYIYDRTDSSHVIFYQLDGWHEATHPYYWSKDFLIEAENYDDSVVHPLHTEFPAGTKSNDFTQFTTYVDCAAGVKYSFETRDDTVNYYVWVKARCGQSNPLKTEYLGIGLDGGTIFAIKNIAKGNFQWYCQKINGTPSYFTSLQGFKHTLELFSEDHGSLEVDKILISRSSEMPKD